MDLLGAWFRVTIKTDKHISFLILWFMYFCETNFRKNRFIQSIVQADLYPYHFLLPLSLIQIRWVINCYYHFSQWGWSLMEILINIRNGHNIANLERLAKLKKDTTQINKYQWYWKYWYILPKLKHSKGENFKIFHMGHSKRGGG